MTIFKKSLNESFLHRISHRIVQEYSSMMKKRLKLFGFISLTGFAITSLAAIITYLLGINISTLNIFLGAFFVSSIASWLLVALLITFLKEKVNKSASSPIHLYHILSKMGWKKLVCLNQEEMKELFNIPLDSFQINYLQNIIVQHNTVNLSNLYHMPETKDALICLNDFFTKNDIRIPDSLRKTNEKENTLMSRL